MDSPNEANPPAGPTRLARRSWIAALRRTLSEFGADELTDRAAALTYYSILAIFPGLIAVVSVAGLIGDAQAITAALSGILGELGADSPAASISEPVKSLTAQPETAGVLLAAGVVGAVLSASGYVGAFTRAANVVFEVREGRPIWKRKPLELVITFGAVVLVVAITLGLVLTGPVVGVVGDYLGLGSATQALWAIAKWPVLLAMATLIIATLYYLSPNVRQRGFRWVLPGTVVALVVWLIASAGFAFYVANFASYDRTYGALGGVISFLVWLWLTNVAILLGVELNSELERGREIEAGLPAEREIQLAPIDRPSEPKTL